MSRLTTRPPTVLDGDVRALWTDASGGDLRPGAGDDGRALAAAIRGNWSAGTPEVHWADQVHGRSVAIVRAASGSGRHAVRAAVCEGPADALVGTSRTVALAVLTADCAPVALASREGVFAAVHAGWRGLCRGVVAAAVDAMRDEGASDLTAMRGPCIRPCCYEFSPGDLDAVADRWGESMRATTRGGRSALDLPAAVSAALAAAGVRELPGAEVCTACGEGYFSHRARHDAGRQALLVWRAGGPDER